MTVLALHLPSSGGLDYPANNAAFIHAGQMAEWVMNNPLSLLPILAIPALTFFTYRGNRQPTQESKTGTL